MKDWSALMLDPHHRRLLLESLRPPDGYDLDFAIGTTFSLDLLALLTAPLGFTLFELQDSDGTELGDADAMVLLRTLRRYADRLTIFCQAGRIAVPKGQRRLLASLEGAVVEVTAPEADGVFHPKVWALRFANARGPTLYRLLVLSRNLTFDRSWDTILVLDGELLDRTNAIADNHGLGDLVQALPDLAVRTVAGVVADRVEQMQYELRRVRFACPPDVERVTFHALGLEGSRNPFRGRIDRMLVMSPFLSATTLDRLAGEGKDAILVSRMDELEKIPREYLDRFARVFALSPDAAGIVEDPAAVDAAQTGLSAGLHAKLYIADAGRQARVWTGSANATMSAFTRNVEFLAELEGKKSIYGIDAILGTTDGATRFRDLLVPFEPREQPIEQDLADEAIEQALEQARTALSAVGWRAVVTTTTTGFDLVLRPLAPRVSAPLGVESVRAHPITLGEGRASSSERLLEFHFSGLSLEALTSFFAFEVAIVRDGRRGSCRFVINAELEGAPAERREAVLRSLLRDRQRVIRYLLLLLSDDEQILAGESGPANGVATGAGADTRARAGGEALLEPLLRALHKDPERLDHVERLLRDLQQSPTNAEALLPDGLQELFDPIWRAREQMR